jgi:inorganic pyrophosphatase
LTSFQKIFLTFSSGETDWKVLTIQVSDPLANELNDIADVEKHIPSIEISQF